MRSTVILYGLLLPVDSIQILCLIFMKTVRLIEKIKCTGDKMYVAFISTFVCNILHFRKC